MVSVGHPRSGRRWALGLLCLLGRYFRADVVGLDRIPDGPAVLVGNHSGGMGSPDFIFAVSYLLQSDSTDDLCVLGHSLLTKAPGLGRVLRHWNIVPATVENALQALREGRKVLIYPGGDLDSLRPFRSRDKVIFGGRRGFAAIAMRAGVPIVPVVTAGAHETFYVLAQGRRLARWLRMERLIGLRTFPIIFCLPWIVVVGPLSLVPYWPLPAKVSVEVGEAIRPEGSRNSKAIQSTYELVHSVMQSMLDRLYAKRRFPVIG